MNPIRMTAAIIALSTCCSSAFAQSPYFGTTLPASQGQPATICGPDGCYARPGSTCGPNGCTPNSTIPGTTQPYFPNTFPNTAPGLSAGNPNAPYFNGVGPQRNDSFRMSPQGNHSQRQPAGMFGRWMQPNTRPNQNPAPQINRDPQPQWGLPMFTGTFAPAAGGRGNLPTLSDWTLN